MRLNINVKENPFKYSPKGLAYEYLKEISKSNTDIKYLDFGCRNGDLLYELQINGVIKTGIGVDLDKNAIADAKNRGVDIDYRLIKKNHKFSEDDNSFDVITVIGVVEHVYDQISLLKELKRILKPKGILIVAVPGKHLFSFLDMGNFKFRFPKLHKFFVRFKYSEEQYYHRYVSNDFGCIGDIESEKSWHEHFSRLSMQNLIEKVKDLEILDIDGLGFFHRIFNNIKYFLPKKIKPVMNSLINWDLKKYYKCELIFLLRKTQNQ